MANPVLPRTAVTASTASTGPATAARTGAAADPPPAPEQRRAPRGVGRWTRRLLLANLVAEVGIVVTGGVVRLTGSGLGCPTWPQCAPGSYVPVAHQAQGWHKDVEFGNRLLTSVVSVLAVAVLVAVWRVRPARRRLRAVAVLPLVGVAVQAVVGGISVLTHLSPAVVALHFLLSMVLITVSALLVVRAGEGDGPPRALVARPVVHLGRVVAVVTAAVLVLGTVVTGSGPHSGDGSTPARFALDPRTVSWLHADLVLLLLGLSVGMLVALRVDAAAPALAARRAWWLLGVLLAQGAVGYTQYATGLPSGLVAVHMLGACLTVVAVTGLLVSLRERAGASSDGLPSDAQPDVVGS